MAAIAGVVLAAPVPAASQGQPSGREAIEQAREHMERGQELYLKEDYQKAADAFEKAYEVQAFSAFLYNAAMANEKAGNPDTAADLYTQYLEKETGAEDKAEVRRRIEALRTKAVGGEEAGTAPPTEGEEKPGAEGEEAPKADEGPEDAEAADAETDETEGDETDAPDKDGEPSAEEGEAADEDTEAEADAAEGEGAVDEAPEDGATEAKPTDEPDDTAGGDKAPAEGTPGTTPKASATGGKRQMKSLLSVQTEPRDARVMIRRDGEQVASGGAPFAQSLAQGRYQLVVEHPDYRTVEEEVRVRAGKVYVVIVRMSQGAVLGLLRVTTKPPDATLYVDDRSAGPVGQTPWQGQLASGEHRLWIERPGYKTEERKVEVAPGDETAVRKKLEPVDYGRLKVDGNIDGARVYVDGELAGHIPYEGRHEAGMRRVRVEADDKKAWVETVRIKKGKLRPIRVTLRPSVARGGAWAATVFSTLFLSGGITLTVMANDMKDDLVAEQEAGRLQSNDPRLQRGKIFRAVADASIGLGAVLTGVSLYLFLRDPLPDSTGRVQEAEDWAMVPRVGPNGGGTTLRWSF